MSLASVQLAVTPFYDLNVAGRKIEDWRSATGLGRNVRTCATCSTG